MSVFTAIAALLFGAAPASASGKSAEPREGVRVMGLGEIFGEPDVVVADLAVETAADTVGQALDRAGAAAIRMRDTLRRAGVAGADLQTSNVVVSSRMNDDREITGYTVGQGLTAKIRDLPRAGALMSEAVAAGGDAARVNGVSFLMEDDAALLAQARTKAFADARGKAELYAHAAGRSLGRVLSVSEVAPGDGVPIATGGMAAADMRFPLEPGQLRVAVTVTVEWAFGPPPAG